MRKLIVGLILVLLLSPFVYSQSKSTYKDKHGNTVGSSVSTPNGDTKYYDKHGNMTGSSKTTKSGDRTTIIYKDKHGNNVGRKEIK